MTGQGTVYNSNYRPWLRSINTNTGGWGSSSGWGNAGIGWGNTTGWGSTPSWGATGLTSSSASSQTSSSGNQSQEEAKNKILQEWRSKNASTIFQGFTKKEEEILLKEHAKTFEPTVKLGSSLALGLGMGGVMKNGGIISHPWNSAKAALPNSATNLMFKGNKELWKSSSNLMQEAYYQMYKAERRSNSHWLNMFKKKYSKTTYDAMENMMYNAVKSGNVDEIAKVTATFKEMGINDGWLTSLFRKIRGKTSTPDSILNAVKNGTLDADTAKSIAGASATLSKTANLTLGKAFKQSVGGPIGLVMGLAGAIPEIQNYKLVKEKNPELAKKQLKQSGVKFAANWGGYIAGETVGTWAGAKLGATIGSVVPGLGTAIGAVAGMVCGTLVSHFAGKWAKKKMGDNVSNQVKTTDLTQSQEGIAQIQQTLLAQAQSGEIKDEKTLELISRFQATA